MINSILTYITHAFFGIEESIWNSIDSNERQKFNSLSFTIVLISIISFIGLYEFFILLLNYVLIAIVLGLIFALIVINIFRFSVFTIQKPIYHQPEIQKPVVETTNSLPENLTEQANNPLVAKQIITSFKDKLLKLGSFFSIGMIVRSVINLILLLFIAFPFACILSNNLITKVNENRRVELIEGFKVSEQIKFKSNCEKEDTKIQLLQEKVRLHPNTMYLSELSKELLLRDELVNTWEKEKNQNITDYETKIANRNFIILSYSKTANGMLLKMSLLFLGLLLFLCHFQKYQLVNHSNYKYYTLANKQYSNLAVENYKEVEKLIKVELAKKYSKIAEYELLLENYESIKANSKFTNPPFNSTEKDFKIPVKKMTTIEFINHYV
jgi:hypothetical protein